MASQAGRMYTGFGSVHYSASKAGQIGLSRVLAGELGPFNITVNCVSPSRTASAMALSFSDADKIEAQYIARTPLGRTATPQDVAATVAFLASDEAAYITGTIVDVTGGFFMPSSAYARIHPSDRILTLNSFTRRGFLLRSLV
jgi:3-oxoacyl-[acyl-carrier protein] reductase